MKFTLGGRSCFKGSMPKNMHKVVGFSVLVCREFVYQKNVGEMSELLVNEPVPLPHIRLVLMHL